MPATLLAPRRSAKYPSLKVVRLHEGYYAVTRLDFEAFVVFVNPTVAIGHAERWHAVRSADGQRVATAATKDAIMRQLDHVPNTRLASERRRSA